MAHDGDIGGDARLHIDRATAKHPVVGIRGKVFGQAWGEGCQFLAPRPQFLRVARPRFERTIVARLDGIEMAQQHDGARAGAFDKGIGVHPFKMVALDRIETAGGVGLGKTVLSKQRQNFLCARDLASAGADTVHAHQPLGEASHIVVPLAGHLLPPSCCGTSLFGQLRPIVPSGASRRNWTRARADWYNSPGIHCGMPPAQQSRQQDGSLRHDG